MRTKIGFQFGADCTIHWRIRIRFTHLIIEPIIFWEAEKWEDLPHDGFGIVSKILVEEDFHLVGRVISLPPFDLLEIAAPREIGVEPMTRERIGDSSGKDRILQSSQSLLFDLHRI